MRLFAVLIVWLCQALWFPALAAPAGAILWKRPSALTVKGADVWDIAYASIDDAAHPNAFTGLVIVPKRVAAAARVLAWVHPTVGIAEKCVPSRHDLSLDEIPSLADLVGRGIVIAATDLTPAARAQPVPYLVGPQSGRAVLDSVRAAQTLVGSGGHVAIWGVSQGGHAALWAADIAHTYAPDLKLSAIVAAAPPTDLKADFDQVQNQSVRALVTAYLSVAWSRYYKLSLPSTVGSVGRWFIEATAARCIRFRPLSTMAAAGLFALTGDVPAHLEGTWRRLMRQNSVPLDPPAVPALILQGARDGVVLPSVTRQFVSDVNGRGGTIRYEEFPMANHVGITAASASQALSWIELHLAGQAQN